MTVPAQTPPPPGTRPMRVVFFLALLAAILGAFGGGIHAKITGDNRIAIYGNSAVTEPGGILRAFQGDFCAGCQVPDAQLKTPTGFYRPILNAVYWLEYRFAGTNDAVYNFDQLLFHWACALMVFFFAARLLPGAPLAPFVAATLFALHPANAYAATSDARADTLCLLFYLGALAAYLRAFSQAGPPRGKFVIIALACYLGACLSKETGVTLPAVLVMLHARQHYAYGRPWREAWYTVPFWVLFGLYLAMRAFLLPPAATSLYLQEYAPHVLYINAIKNFPVYLLRYAVPLGSQYPSLLPNLVNFIDPSLTDPAIYLSALLPALIAGIALWSLKKRPTEGFLACFLLIAMTPLAAVTRITDVPDINVIKAPERVMYLPSVALLLLAALLAQKAVGRLRTGAARTGAAIAGALAALFLGYQSGIHSMAIGSDVAALKSFFLLPEERLTPKMRALRECFYVQFVDMPKRDFAGAEKRISAVLDKNPAMPIPYVEMGFVYLESGQWERIGPFLKRWNNLSQDDIWELKKQNPTVLNEYLRSYHNFPYLLGAAAARGGEAAKAADLLCSALRRGFGEKQIAERLRENYLLNGPPRCRTADDIALCMQNSPVPDFAQWRPPLDPKQCGNWKKLF